MSNSIQFTGFNGYQAEGSAAINQVMENLTKLEQTMNENAVKEISIQKDQMNSTAKAALAAGRAMRLGDICQAVQQGAQGLGSVVNLGLTARLNKNAMSEAEKPQAKLQNASEFEDALKNAGARTTITNRPTEELDATAKQRYQQIVEGQGELKLQTGDERLLDHIAVHDKDRAALTAHINKTKQSAIEEQNMVYNNSSRAQQRVEAAVNIGQQAASASTSGIKAQTADLDQGNADARKGLAQTAEGQAQSSASQQMDAASGFASLVAQVLRTQEALAAGAQG